MPSAIYLTGTAGAALAWGYLMESLGRRGGLVLGLAIGAFGAALAYGAINAGSFVAFLAGLALMGVASAALTLGRFASAEVHPPAERGRAISTVVLGGTVGAVLGPLLVGPAGAWAAALGQRDLSGAYAVTGLFLLVAGVVIFSLLRPDPRDVGRAVAAYYPIEMGAAGGVRTLRAILGKTDVRLAILSMVLGQAVMSLTDLLKGEIAIKHENVTIDNIAPDTSTYIKAQEGSSSTNSIRLTLTRDSRDNFLNPTVGNHTLVSGEYAGGFLGGDNYFTKAELEHSLYVPLFWRFVGMAHGKYGRLAGFDDRQPPISEKFFLGGSYSLRGFEYREVGPKDSNGDPIGGSEQLYFNFELICRIIPEQGLNLVAFYDTRNVARRSALLGNEART